MYSVTDSLLEKQDNIRIFFQMIWMFFGQILNLELKIKDQIKLLQMVLQMLMIWIHLVRTVVLFFKKIFYAKTNTGRVAQQWVAN